MELLLHVASLKGVHINRMKGSDFFLCGKMRRNTFRQSVDAVRLGVVPEPTHQVEEEERHGAQLHAGRPRGGPERRGLGERGGGRGVQQAAGPRLGRRQDPPAAPEAPPGLLGAPPRSEPRLTISQLPPRERARTNGRHYRGGFHSRDLVRMLNYFFPPLLRYKI